MNTAEISLNQNIIFLTGQLNFDTVAHIYQSQLSGLIKEVLKMEQQSFILDLSKVNEIDSSAMALIIELYRELEHSGKTITTRHVSSQLESLASLCDVDDFFKEKLSQ